MSPDCTICLYCFVCVLLVKVYRRNYRSQGKSTDYALCLHKHVVDSKRLVGGQQFDSLLLSWLAGSDQASCGSFRISIRVSVVVLPSQCTLYSEYFCPDL